MYCPHVTWDFSALYSYSNLLFFINLQFHTFICCIFTEQCSLFGKLKVYIVIYIQTKNSCSVLFLGKWFLLDACHVWLSLWQKQVQMTDTPVVSIPTRFWGTLIVIKLNMTWPPDNTCIYLDEGHFRCHWWRTPEGDADDVTCRRGTWVPDDASVLTSEIQLYRDSST